MAQHTRKSQESERKKIVRVVTALVEPFVMIKRDCEMSNATECQGNARFEGSFLLNSDNCKFMFPGFLGKTKINLINSKLNHTFRLLH